MKEVRLIISGTVRTIPHLYVKEDERYITMYDSEHYPLFSFTPEEYDHACNPDVEFMIIGNTELEVVDGINLN